MFSRNRKRRNRAKRTLPRERRKWARISESSFDSRLNKTLCHLVGRLVSIAMEAEGKECEEKKEMSPLSSELKLKEEAENVAEGLSSGGRQTVCVTGATGYLAGHIIRFLLDEGHTVHGTVRSLKQTSRVAHLTSHPDSATLLKLFEADLTKEGSFDAAVSGSTCVMHVANVVQLTSKDPIKDIIEPSVNGLRTLLSSVEKEAGISSFILTSSYAAIEVGIPDQPRSLLTEADSNTAASPKWKPYSFRFFFH